MSEPGGPATGGAAGLGSAGASPLLDVRGLSVCFDTAGGLVRAVDGVSFELHPGEVLAIVGESGAGKSVCAMTLMGLTRGPRTRIEGSARLQGQELIGMDEAHLRRIRGARMAMVFQDPMSSLSPVHRVGDQIAEQIRAHQPSVSRARAGERAVELMERVRIPAARARSRAYPHELSGGMRQRVMIAMALSLGPSVLLADEPTTALDVTVQAQILALLRELREQMDLAMVLVTHDFGVVADSADRIAVMRRGEIVEQGIAEQVLQAAEHPYTRGLLRALEPPPPRPRGRAGDDVEGEGAASAAESVSASADGGGRALLEVSELRVHYPGRGRSRGVLALDGVSLSVRAGETLAVVGESGAGKTTLLRAIARLVDPAGGAITLDGHDMIHARGRRLAALRRPLAMVFQDSQASLNPRMRVGRTLERALRARGLTRAQARTRAAELLERVGLQAAHRERFPYELSGGERQRVGIARALAGEPRLVLLDEPVSSLDASIRRGVIELLVELQAQTGCAYVLVSHDLSTVAEVADRIAVMRAGRVVELGDAPDVLERPRDPYTQALLAAVPPVPSTVGLSRRVRSETWTTRGASFSTWSA